jgi:hypothetical protein
VKNSWIFPVIESIHLVGVALLVGTIALSDYQLISHRSPAETVLPRWTRVGLLIMLTTGPLMFWTDVHRYIHNPAFRFKMMALATASVFHFTARRRCRGRWVGIVSLALWSCVVLGGRAIADFDLL